MKPSDKQLDFAMAIGEELGIDPPFDGDSEDYSDFISENVEDFYKERNKRRYATGEIFSLDHSYSYGSYNYDSINKNPESI